MKRAIRLAVVATAIGSLMACGGSSPTPPTTPAPTPANIAGSYDMTLAASPTCSQNLPPATRMLTYVASISQTGTNNDLVIMTLSGDVSFGEVAISGKVTGQELKITQFTYSEKTSGGGIALVATGNATIAANGSITGTLSGVYQTPTGASCNSTAHGIQMIRR